MFKKFKKLFQKDIGDVFLIDHVIYTKLTPIVKLLEQHYLNKDTHIAYIINNEDDVNTLIHNLLNLSEDNVVSQYILSSYNILKNHTDTLVLLIDGTKYNVEVLDEINLNELIESEEIRVFDIPEVRKTSLFKYYMKLQKLNSKLKILALDQYNKTHDTNTYVDGMFEHLRHNQDFIDYLVKLDSIGNNPEIFQVFTNEDDEVIHAFFQPIDMLIDYIESTKENQKKQIEEFKKQQLNSILNWNSTQVQEIKPPVENTLLTDQLNDDDLFKNPFEEPKKQE